MGNLLSITPIIDDWGGLKRIAISESNRIFNLLIEEKGSFRGQFEKAKEISEKLIDNLTSFDNKSEYDDEEYRYILQFGTNLGSICRGRTIGNTVTIGVDRRYLNKIDLSNTIAHELMHQFQGELKEVNGVNLNSMRLYQYLLSFANSTDSVFCSNFFYGLYACFSIEAAANVSSISSYLSEYFKDKDVTTQEITDALEKCNKYNLYLNIRDYLSYAKPSLGDLEYIKGCLTDVRKDPYGQGDIRLYETEGFDTRKFVKDNVKQIILRCDETIKKMHKNAMIFLEKRSQ